MRPGLTAAEKTAQPAVTVSPHAAVSVAAISIPSAVPPVVTRVMRAVSTTVPMACRTVTRQASTVEVLPVRNVTARRTVQGLAAGSSIPIAVPPVAASVTQAAHPTAPTAHRTATRRARTAVVPPAPRAAQAAVVTSVTPTTATVTLPISAAVMAVIWDVMSTILTAMHLEAPVSQAAHASRVTQTGTATAGTTAPTPTANAPANSPT